LLRARTCEYPAHVLAGYRFAGANAIVNGYKHLAQLGDQSGTGLLFARHDTSVEHLGFLDVPNQQSANERRAGLETVLVRQFGVRTTNFRRQTQGRALSGHGNLPAR